MSMVKWSNDVLNWESKAPYQTEFMEDVNKREIPFAIWMMGRQMGKTELLCMSLLFLAHSRFVRLPAEMPTTIIGMLQKWFNRRILKKRSSRMRGASFVLYSPDTDKMRIVFERTLKFIEKSPLLAEARALGQIEVRKSGTPKIVVHNQNWEAPATILFSVGNSPAAISYADYTFVDEPAYISDKFLRAIMNTAPKLWMTGTPSRHHGVLYDEWMNPESKFQKYHHAAQENPLFTEETATYFREHLTPEQYKYEMDAEW